MDFEFTRGDTQILKFRIEDFNGNVCELDDGDKLYFTVKKSANSKKVVFQKRLDSGIVYSDDEGYYYINIGSADTAGLDYGTYGFDLQLKTAGGIVKTLLIGSMTLSEEYTYKEDEV